MPHVTFIHGLANKPPADELHNIWVRALAQDDGISLGTKGVTSSMVYWADVLHEKPAEEQDSHESVGGEAVTEESDDDNAWREELADEEVAFVNGLANRLDFDKPSPNDDKFTPEPNEDPGFERIPLPWFIKRRLMKALLKDLHHYLFNSEFSPRSGVTYRVRDEIRSRFVKALKRDAAANNGGPHVVISHSMGTVIAYDCLKRIPDCPKIDALMTIGSPLGLDEIQDKLQPGWSKDDGYPKEKVASGWANVYDRLDPVALDAELANDFKEEGRKIVVDQRQRNKGKWRHGIDNYLIRDELRKLLAGQLGINWE